MKKAFVLPISLGLALLGPYSGSHLLAQGPPLPVLTETALELDDGEQLRFAISVPPATGDAVSDARPLVLALHPGGRSVYYGSWFMQSIVEPALRDWDAVIVAPDVPDRNWASERSERAVLALLDDVMEEHAIDRTRVLITGFSMGGRGTWYLASRSPDLFTGAIVMAASTGEASLDGLAEMPLYIIHSPDDEVVPYEPVEATALLLAERGYPVQMLRLPGASHGMMGDYISPLRAAGEWLQGQWQVAGPQDR